MASANVVQTSVAGGNQNALALQGDGVFFPKVSTASRLALGLSTSDTGFVVYDTQVGNLFFWTGTAWVGVPTSGSPGLNQQVQYNNNGVVQGATGFTFDNVTNAVAMSGDLTVDTSTLVVESSTNRVRIAKATAAAYPLDVAGRISYNGAIGEGPDTTVSSSGTSLLFGNSATWGDTQFFAGGNLQYRVQSAGVFTWLDGAGGTRMFLNATGLGVGNAPVAALDVYKVANDTINRTNATFCFGQIAGLGAALLGQQSASAPYQFNLQAANAANSVQFPLVLQPSGGNVGIGVTPSAWAVSYKSIEVGAIGSFANDPTNVSVGANRFFNGANSIYKTTAAASVYNQTAGTHAWYNAPSGTAGNAITFTQAMTLTAGGDLLVGTTTSALSRIISSFLSSSGNGGIKLIDSQSNNTAIFANFSNGTGTLGTITNNNNAGVLYNTISDYRLKESVTPLSGGLARVNALKPSIYKWKSSGLSGEGFLAHELAEVVPFAVSGEKDAVSEDGAIQYQGIDMSRVVPILVAAIQELTARVQTLEAK